MTSDDFGNFYVTGWSASNQFPTVNPGGGAFCVTALNNQLMQFFLFHNSIRIIS
jgi:hypothetical protein